MRDNKFYIAKVAQWREESSKLLSSLGLRPGQYEELLGEIADMATQKVVSRASQFLFDFKEKGSAVLSERYEVSDRTIRNWKKSALELQFGKTKAA